MGRVGTIVHLLVRPVDGGSIAFVLDATTYLDHVRRDGERIAAVTEGNLEAEVPACPGNTVGSLLVHTAGFCTFATTALSGPERKDPDWSLLAGDDPLATHRRQHGALVDRLASIDPETTEVWTWGTDDRALFWFRRAACELVVHRWDFENALGAETPIDPTLAGDGVHEFLSEFGRSTQVVIERQGAAELLGAEGARIGFVPTDGAQAWTATSGADAFDVQPDGDADLTIRGTAGDLLLCAWGRDVDDRLEVEGDRALFQRYRDRVKI